MLEKYYPKSAIKKLHRKVKFPHGEEMTSMSAVEVAHYTCACKTSTYVFFVPDRQQFILITPTQIQYSGSYSLVINGFEILPHNLAESLKGIIVRNMALVLFRWVTGLDEGLVDTMVAQQILHKNSAENEANKK